MRLVWHGITETASKFLNMTIYAFPLTVLDVIYLNGHVRIKTTQTVTKRRLLSSAKPIPPYPTHHAPVTADLIEWSTDTKLQVTAVGRGMAR